MLKSASADAGRIWAIVPQGGTVRACSPVHMGRPPNKLSGEWLRARTFYPAQFQFRRSCRKRPVQHEKILIFSFKNLSSTSELRLKPSHSVTLILALRMLKLNDAGFFNLFDGNTLGQVSGLIDFTPIEIRNVISQ